MFPRLLSLWLIPLALLKFSPFLVSEVLNEKHYDISPCEKGIKVSEKQIVFSEGCPLRTYWIHRLFNSSGQLIELSEEGEGMTKTTLYHYNSQNQLEEVIKPDGRSLYYSYNQEGRISRFEAGDGSFCYRYHYDPSKRLVRVEDLCHQLIQTISRLNEEEWMEEQGPAMRLIYQQDACGRRVGMTLPDSSRVIYDYEGDQIVGIERLDKHQHSCYFHSFEYDEQGQLLSQSSMQGRRESVPEGGWDAKGRLLKLIREEGEEREEHTFCYTEEGFLANEKSHAYTYDSLFNRLSHQGQEWKINGLNQLVETPHASYCYDANGNLIEKQTPQGSVVYAYDALDRLIWVEYPKEKAFSYLYDPFHRRLSEIRWKWQEEQEDWALESKEWMLYDGFKEIGKFNDQGECLEFRLLAPPIKGRREQAIALELGGKVLIPLHDFWGSVCSLVDPVSGEKLERYTYSAYGEEEIFNGEGEKLSASFFRNAWRFWGQRKDETGLIFFGRRYYDPEMGRWITPDPFFFHDTSNLYAFSRNDPINYYDSQGLFSVAHLWANLTQCLAACFESLFQPLTWKSLRLPQVIHQETEKLGREFLKGRILIRDSYGLMGLSGEETEQAAYGDVELSEKVRCSFINGMLINKVEMLSNLEFISQAHGNTRVHYIFRPTEGFTLDGLRAIWVKISDGVGYRSPHAHLLAKKWRELIAEMGGVEGGGVILHYAHSLGGTETDRARKLLTPEEQKRIRVVTFGSPTIVGNEGFSQVINVVGIYDGVCIFDPLGRGDPDNTIWFLPGANHLLQGGTYQPVMHRLGEACLVEFKGGGEEETKET